MSTIQAPSKGRVVILTAESSNPTDKVEPAREYPAIVAQAHGSVVDLVTFGPHSIYHHLSVPYSSHGHSYTSKSWRWPEQVRDQIDVGDA